jgi:AcrR family transcriptional regulator
MAARTYRMTARSASSDVTRRSILDATIALAYELGHVAFPLEQIAARSGRSVQTILRHFRSRDALFEAAIQQGAAEVAAERRPPDGDPGTALDLLVEHYERRGGFVLRLLAMGEQFGAETVTGPGRLLHRAWVDEVFAVPLRTARDRDALVDMLVVATDVYAWKLLRLDRGLATAVVRSRIGDMVASIVAGAR